MSTDFRPPSREEAIADEYLTELVEKHIADLAAIYEPPWRDAGPEGQERSEEESDDASAALYLRSLSSYNRDTL